MEKFGYTKLELTNEEKMKYLSPMHLLVLDSFNVPLDEAVIFLNEKEKRIWIGRERKKRRKKK